MSPWEHVYDFGHLSLPAEVQADIEQQMTCEHPNPWFSREICACGDMHYFCNECGSQVDPCWAEARS